MGWDAGQASCRSDSLCVQSATGPAHEPARLPGPGQEAATQQAEPTEPTHPTGPGHSGVCSAQPGQRGAHKVFEDEPSQSQQLFLPLLGSWGCSSHPRPPSWDDSHREPSSNQDITKPAPGPARRSWSRGWDGALPMRTLPSTRTLEAREGSPVPWLGIQERMRGHGPSSDHLQEEGGGQARRVQEGLVQVEADLRPIPKGCPAPCPLLQAPHVGRSTCLPLARGRHPEQAPQAPYSQPASGTSPRSSLLARCH